MQGSKGDTDVKNRLLDSMGEGEGGVIWEINTETCILPYVKQMTLQSFCKTFSPSSSMSVISGDRTATAQPSTDLTCHDSPCQERVLLIQGMRLFLLNKLLNRKCRQKGRDGEDLGRGEKQDFTLLYFQIINSLNSFAIWATLEKPQTSDLSIWLFLCY